VIKLLVRMAAVVGMVAAGGQVAAQGNVANPCAIPKALRSFWFVAPRDTYLDEIVAVLGSVRMESVPNTGIVKLCYYYDAGAPFVLSVVADGTAGSGRVSSVKIVRSRPSARQRCSRLSPAAAERFESATPIGRLLEDVVSRYGAVAGAEGTTRVYRSAWGAGAGLDRTEEPAGRCEVALTVKEGVIVEAISSWFFES
jgi:hypothetical protein